MKKNKMMRLASGLLVAVLITTSTISGTFAKYVTSDSASDTARVAKFGVTVTATGNLFDKNYKDAPTTTETEMSVVSSDSQNLVAPGTKSPENGLKFAITGKPEVDVKIDVSVKGVDVQGNEIDTPKDVFLAVGTYQDKTTQDENDTFTTTAVYNPIKYTLWKNGKEVNGVKDVTLETLVNAIENLGVSEVDANTDLADATNGGFGEFNITWEWDFDDEGRGTYDKEDTLLGCLAVDPTLADDNSYNLYTGLKITVTVTQLD